MDQEQRTFKIPSPNMQGFQERFNKLVKRAIKIGCVPPSFSIVKEEPTTIEVIVGETEDEYGNVRPVKEQRVILYHHITLQSPSVVVEGFEFISAVEHTEEGNVLHTLKGLTCPDRYFNAKPNCDHCKLDRRRKDTFIVRHVETDTYRQVGRNCLADYLGRDGERVAAAFELYTTAEELADASEECGSGSWGGGGARYEMLDKYLAYVAEVIRIKGWRSRSTAHEFGGESTADIAMQHLHPTDSFLKYGEVLFRIPPEQSVQEAKDAIAWCDGLLDSEVEGSEYLHNIRVIARRGVIGARQFGYAASIVSSYQKHLGTLKRKEKLAEQALISKHVGVVGERGRFLLTVDHVVHIPDYGYGSSSLYLMGDENGNRFTWKSGNGGLEKGKTYLLKGTVKEHGEYKGVAQTKLSRCEVVELRRFVASVVEVNPNAGTIEVEAENEKEAKKLVCDMLGVRRLPKGMILVSV